VTTQGLAFVSFSSEITPQPTETLIALMSQLAVQGAREVHLLLSTFGGSVMHGMNLYNVLKGMPYKLVTHNVGSVNSIGNVVFLAGEQRFACPHTTFMFHGVAAGMGHPNQRLEEKLIVERLEGLRADQRRIGAVIQERSSLSLEDIESMFLQQQTRDADWAVDAGIAHEIREVDIPDGAAVHGLVFQRQAVVGQ
jgi:ATP-dependent protease ClpP protease subunit